MRGYHRTDEIIIVIKEMTEDAAMHLRQHACRQQGLHLAFPAHGILKTMVSGTRCCCREARIKQQSCPVILCGCFA
ncbi:hypothetical protein L2D08_13060 [Domibacillus sp. PGB-M46]|uniref:hypothetical protein n=1 Tax=Domibacillus sp. PGB-M46 TaxID=2910255 RepID=UPI001F572F92|nr:hypothetical protein [Domibacillus sp. PGB-M46]MCI2255296.1 hypothetical protein [Domibacillus sp. PGB-M46]